MRVCIYVYIHTYIYTYDTYVYTYDTYIHTYDTYIHTYDTYIYTYVVSSSHLVHHELVDGNSLACRLAWHLCNGKSFTIPCSFIEGKPKIGAGEGRAETAETAETAENCRNDF